MNKKRFNASPPGIFPEDSPGITLRKGEAETQQKQESSKRQQCVRATELAKRTGLEFRYAGLFETAEEPYIKNKRNSGKAFDESGRRSLKGIPGRKGDRVSCHWKSGCMIAPVPLRTAVFIFQRRQNKDRKGAGR